jgi:DNA-binding transcriptional MerR regulator
MGQSMTTGAVARLYDVPVWRVRRLYERGLLPPPERVGPYRVIPASDLPVVAEALRRAGYLDTDVEHQKECT